MEARPRGGAEAGHTRGEAGKRPVHAREYLRVVGVGLEEAERLVEPAERARGAERRPLERVQQGELLGALPGGVAGRDGGEGVDQPAARGHLGL